MTVRTSGLTTSKCTAHTLKLREKITEVTTGETTADGLHCRPRTTTRTLSCRTVCQKQTAVLTGETTFELGGNGGEGREGDGGMRDEDEERGAGSKVSSVEDERANIDE